LAVAKIIAIIIIKLAFWATLLTLDSRNILDSMSWRYAIVSRRLDGNNVVFLHKNLSDALYASCYWGHRSDKRQYMTADVTLARRLAKTQTANTRCNQSPQRSPQ